MSNVVSLFSTFQSALSLFLSFLLFGVSLTVCVSECVHTRLCFWYIMLYILQGALYNCCKYYWQKNDAGIGQRAPCCAIRSHEIMTSDKKFKNPAARSLFGVRGWHNKILYTKAKLRGGEKLMWGIYVSCVRVREHAFKLSRYKKITEIMKFINKYKLRSKNCVCTLERDDVLCCVLLPLSNGVSGQTIDQLNKMQPHVHVQDKAAANPVAGLLSVKVPALGKKRGLPNWKVNHFFLTNWHRFLVWVK